MTDAASRVINHFGLAPHPEGGWFREVFRSSHRVQTAREERAALTVIHYMLASGTCSRWHRVDADEAWFFSDGSAIEHIIAAPDFSSIVRRRLIDVTPVSVAPAGWWQAAYTEGDWALVQCAVAPGFEFSGFQLARDAGYAEAVREDLTWLL
ncbi:MAG: cupin domain-containing protein [Gemmatimonadota bacterium]